MSSLSIQHYNIRVNPSVSSPEPFSAPEAEIARAYHWVIKRARAAEAQYNDVGCYIESAAIAGLFRAARRWDPSYGVPFFHFATRVVHGCILEVVKRKVLKQPPRFGFGVDLPTFCNDLDGSPEEIEISCTDTEPEEFAVQTDICIFAAQYIGAERDAVIMMANGRSVDYVRAETGLPVRRLGALRKALRIFAQWYVDGCPQER